MNRPKGNRITNGSISSFEHFKEINKTKKLISDRLNIKVKDTIRIEPQYEEIIIPNWTYSTGLGVVYNPIIEKRVKITRRNAQKKTKNVDSSVVNSMIKLNHNTPNKMKRFHPKSLLPISSKFLSRVNRQHIDNNPIHFNATNKFPSPHYSRCDTIFNKNMFDKSQILHKVFICKLHSSPWSGSNRFIMKNEVTYRMAAKSQSIHLIQRLCH